MKIIKTLIVNVFGILLLSGNLENINYYNKYINNQNELASLNKQLKELSEQFSQQEEGINRQIILNGKYIQYVPKEEKQYYSFYSKDYIFIHEMDMDSTLENLNSSIDDPTIYIIGNKIYKQKKQSKNIYYKKVLKILCNKKLNSNNTDWALYPQNIENWQLKIDNEKKLRNTNYGQPILVDDEEIYNISHVFALENAIYRDIDLVYRNNNDNNNNYEYYNYNAKKKVDNFIEQNFDHVINKINEYLKIFSKTEQGIKELNVLAKYNQTIPFEDFDNKNYIKIYSFLYNIYLANSNPTYFVVRVVIMILLRISFFAYDMNCNKSLILDVIKNGFNDKENNTDKLDIRVSIEKIIPEQTPTLHTIRDCHFFKTNIGLYEMILFSQYKHLENVYNNMKEAQKNQELINKLVEINAESLFLNIKYIINDVCSDNNVTKPYNKIYIFGEYKQVFEFDELEDKLKNTKILRNPFKSYLIEYGLYQNPDNINYMYPLIYNLYISKKRQL